MAVNKVAWHNIEVGQEGSKAKIRLTWDAVYSGMYVDESLIANEGLYVYVFIYKDGETVRTLSNSYGNDSNDWYDSYLIDVSDYGYGEYEFKIQLQNYNSSTRESYYADDEWLSCELIDSGYELPTPYVNLSLKQLSNDNNGNIVVEYSWTLEDLDYTYGYLYLYVKTPNDSKYIFVDGFTAEDLYGEMSGYYELSLSDCYDGDRIYAKIVAQNYNEEMDEEKEDSDTASFVVVPEYELITPYVLLSLSQISNDNNGTVVIEYSWDVDDLDDTYGYLYLYVLTPNDDDFRRVDWFTASELENMDQDYQVQLNDCYAGDIIYAKIVAENYYSADSITSDYHELDLKITSEYKLATPYVELALSQISNDNDGTVVIEYSWYVHDLDDTYGNLYLYVKTPNDDDYRYIKGFTAADLNNIGMTYRFSLNDCYEDDKVYAKIIAQNYNEETGERIEDEDIVNIYIEPGLSTPYVTLSLSQVSNDNNGNVVIAYSWYVTNLDDTYGHLYLYVETPNDDDYRYIAEFTSEDLVVMRGRCELSLSDCYDGDTIFGKIIAQNYNEETGERIERESRAKVVIESDHSVDVNDLDFQLIVHDYSSVSAYLGGIEYLNENYVTWILSYSKSRYSGYETITTGEIDFDETEIELANVFDLDSGTKYYFKCTIVSESADYNDLVIIKNVTTEENYTVDEDNLSLRLNIIDKTSVSVYFEGIQHLNTNYISWNLYRSQSWTQLGTKIKSGTFDLNESSCKLYDATGLTRGETYYFTCRIMSEDSSYNNISVASWIKIEEAPSCQLNYYFINKTITDSVNGNIRYVCKNYPSISATNWNEFTGDIKEALSELGFSVNFQTIYPGDQMTHDLFSSVAMEINDAGISIDNDYFNIMVDDDFQQFEFKEEYLQALNLAAEQLRIAAYGE